VSISFAELTNPGLYSGLLVGDDYRTPGFELSVLQAVVVPHQLARVNGKVFEDEDRLPAGKYKRYYFAVPEGIKEMNLHLETGKKGIARMYAISPFGDYQKSEFVGVGDGDFHPDTSLSLSRPAAGTWEVVVYSSATLNAHNLHHSEYRLWLDLQKDEHFQERLRQDAPFLVAAVPCGDPQGESQHLTLFFWNRNSKQPVDGLISINGRIYEIFRGKVELETRAENGVIPLNIAW
jgi:tripeptidyl-peptidase-2